MSIDQNKAIARRFVEEIFERGSTEAVDEFVAPDFVGHTWGNAKGPDGLKAAMARIANALDDVSFRIDDVIAEGDRVAVRLTARARQVGEFMKMPASGKSYEIAEIHIFRIRDGKVIEHWHQFDQVGMMRQLGAMPGA